MGALGQVLLWLQLGGKRGALIGPARQWGRPKAEVPPGPEGQVPREVGGPDPPA